MKFTMKRELFGDIIESPLPCTTWEEAETCHNWDAFKNIPTVICKRPDGTVERRKYNRKTKTLKEIK